MLKKHSSQYKFQMINLEDLVPEDHLLRKIDKYIDFSFIEGLTYDLYSHETGRPALDPIVLFKMLFIGYLFGIRSERRLVQEINVNLAYRWFIGFDLDEKIPDHSVFSQNRRRRFSQRPELEQEIFDNIVEQAIEHGLITGHFLYSDCTHIKANANKGKFVAAEVEVSPMEYLEQLHEETNQKREDLGKKAFCENRFNLAWLAQLNGTTTKFAGALASDLFLFGFEGAATLPQTLSKMFRNRYLLSLDLTLSTQHRVDVSVF